MKDHKPDPEYPDITSTASATETTGMMPTPAYSDAELAAFQQLSGMQIPKEPDPNLP